MEISRNDCLYANRVRKDIGHLPNLWKKRPNFDIKKVKLCQNTCLDIASHDCGTFTE